MADFDTDEILLDAEERMDKALHSAVQDFTTLRTGRANPSLLNRVTVDYYGAATPLQSLASISVPEPRMLTIQPYDKKAISEIERAILKSDLGLTPSNDGQIIRLNIPPLTEERRRDMVKLAKKMAEDGKVVVRNIRRDAIEHIKKLEKDGLPKDGSKDAQDSVQELTDKYISKLDKALEDKEKDILEQ